ncbi:MAG TPA: Mut7-C RNAse domain-containing protein [Anaeromyxobacter sp.]
MDPPRFVTDSSLEWLARRLRILGFDVLTLRGARLEELFEAGRREKRVVLTMSARHPKRWGDVPARRIERGANERAVRAIAETYEPSGPPFSRCADCNHALQRRLPIEATGEVPGGVLRRARHLRHCPNCGKWYWEGSHVERLREWLERALGRPLGSADDTPSGPDPARGPERGA